VKHLDKPGKKGNKRFEIIVITRQGKTMVKVVDEEWNRVKY
jgi:hypothetical protein